MAGNESTSARILAAHARHCTQVAADLAAARAAGSPAAELADLEAQELAARRRYQELAVDMPGKPFALGINRSEQAQRPWWRFW